MSCYEEKKIKLLERIDALSIENIVLAFSGGVDSSLLLKMCCESAKKRGKKVYAITVHTELHPMKDVEIAAKVAEESGAEHMVVRIDELQDAGIRYNPTDRCYRCKKLLFSRLKEKAGELGAKIIIEGTNEDDLHVYRPGIRALRELEIVSPLAECGFTKQEVRKLAEEYSISVANRPSTPCMATRFPYDTKLDYGAMRCVEEGEEWLKTLGFYNVRIRVHKDIARIEVDENDMLLLLKKRTEVVEKLKSLGYSYITVDLEGFRSGSMDIHITKGE